MEELKSPSQRKASFGKTMKAVMWSFFGIRKKASTKRMQRSSIRCMC